MMRNLIRVVLWLSAPLVPAHRRSRWREEWLAETDATAHRSARMRWRHVLGAPADAWASRPAWGPFFAGWRTDVVHAIRLLFRRPAHTFSVVLCLAAGLTVSIATFSVISSLFFGDQVGIVNRHEIVRLFLSYDTASGQETIAGGQRVSAAPLALDDLAVLRQAGPALGSIAAEGNLRLAVVGRHGAVGFPGAFVTGNYFEVLGTRAWAGRLLTPVDERADAPPAVVVSEYFWRHHLDSAPDAIGAPMLLAGRSFIVVGVVPPRFHGLQPIDVGADESQGLQVWMPLRYATGWPGAPKSDEAWLSGIGRLRANATFDDARGQLSVRAAQLAAAYPSSRAHAGIVLRPHGFGPGDTPLDVLFAIGAVLVIPLSVLAIACANVANLQLARVAERARELAVRLSLGASRGQLIRLLTIETMVLAAAAVGVASLATSVILRLASPSFPIALSIDWHVVAFALGLMLAVTLATGLAPAWLVLRRAAAARLKQTAQAGGLGHSRLRSGLVIAQVTLSLLMLCSSTLFMRSLNSLQLEVPPALRTQIVAEFDPAQVGGVSGDAQHFAEHLRARMEADSRVNAVALSRSIGIRYGTAESDRAVDRFAALVEMTPSWLTVMNVPVLTGRALTAVDGPGVVLVSARLSEMIAPTGSPLGRVLRINDGTSTPRLVEIVGVVADNRTRPMTRGDRPDPVVYAPLAAPLMKPFVIRISARDLDAVETDFRSIVRAIDPNLAWLTLQRGEVSYLEDASTLQLIAISIGGLGLIALSLAATGLYAVMGYVVLLRRREIGVRMAIGADPRQIVVMVIRQAMTLVLIGGAIGVAIAIPAAFGLRSIFIGTITPLDPLVYLPTLAMLLSVAMIAAAIPARRAARIDPIATLRGE